MQVKNNQPALLALCEAICGTEKPSSVHITDDKKKRNRKEYRSVKMFAVNDRFKEALKPDWSDYIAAVACVDRKVWRKKLEEKDSLWILSEETAYYACQKMHSAEVAGKAIRQHWGIESHHHMRDVTLEEDACRIWQKPTMMGRLRSFVSNIFQANKIKNAKQELKRNAFNPQKVMRYNIA